MPETKRQLAAIMFTDIVGYTALMGESEEKALEIRRRNREIHQQQIEAAGGIWLKEMGDGTMASFATITDAVSAAINIRETCKQELDIELKIGIHLGEIIFEDDDVFGDGVNIASRIQELAGGGGILISEPVFNEIRNKENIGASFIGETSLKNVDIPVKVYQVLDRDLVKPSIQIKKGRGHNKLLMAGVALMALLFAAIYIYQKNFSEKPISIKSIAVLPFANYTGDENQAYFVAGMHDALISELGQIGAIRVISKTSTLQYANSQKTIKEIASELNVDAIIEASVLSATDSIRVQLKLINAFPEEQQLWSQTFDSDMSNILNLYSRVIKNIANEIQLTLSPEQQTRLTKTRQVNPKAYEAYLKGKFHMGFLSREGIMAAMDYFNQAISIDPEYAPAYGGVAGAWGALKQFGFVSTDEATPEMEKYLSQAIALDDQLAEIYYWEAIMKVWTDFDWEGGEILFKRCLEINPNFSEARAFYSQLLMFLHRKEEMRAEMKLALENDPNNLLIQSMNAVRLFIEAKYDSSININKKLKTVMPNNPLVLSVLFQSYAQIGEYDLAINEVTKNLEVLADETVVNTLIDEYAHTDFKSALDETADVWEARFDTDALNSFLLIMLYAHADNTEKTLHWIEKGYFRKDGGMPYLGVEPFLIPYHKEPRFIEIMERMDLPFGKF